MRTATWCLVAVLAAMFVGGCAKFTRQNYEMIQIGDDRARVEDVLGKPSQRGNDLWFYRNDKPYYNAKIHFEDHQVSRKEWFDAENRWVQPE